LFAVLDRTFLDRETRKKIKNDKAKSEAREAITSEVAMSEALVSERLLATCERYNTLCDTLLSMSEFFSELGDKMKTPLLCDTKNICDSAFDASCASCKHRGLCYEEKREETMAVINDISAALHRNGSVSVNDVGGHIRSVCQRLHDMLSEINYNYSIYQRQLILCDKTEIFATDYKAMRDLICGAMRLDADDFAVQKELSERLIAKLSEADLNVVSAVVYGTGRLRVLVEGKWEKALKETKDNILETIKTSLEREFALEKESGARIVFCEKKRISAKYATRTASSVLEKEFCGDSSAVFENPDGMLYSVISDGMGSGRDAALTSGICVMFMQKMLLSGADCRTAISLLGAFLRNKGSGSVHECSATLDVMELDTVMGKAVFYKSGAAPTFVMREGRVYKLESRNLPLGIIKDTDTKKLSFEIDDGDIIVMVSDGVCGCGDGAPWLSKLLKEKAERESPKSLAGLILERAKSENESDDISVSVIKIEKER
jgi:stage II sporulation protein E